MNKAELTRTMNNLMKLKDAIINQQVAHLDKKLVHGLKYRAEEEFKLFLFWLEQLKREG